MLGPDEIERYARHLVLPEIGGQGQQRLKAARVLVIGAGGLGSPLIQYLAAAGVGTIGVVDDDTVSLSNLQRQLLHATAAIGEPKTASASRAVAAINPHVALVQHPLRLDDSNAATLIGAYDLVADGSDNFETRYRVADACLVQQRPLVTAALGRFDASLTTIRGFERNRDGEPNPTYRCLFPEPPPAGTIPACAEAGILGAVAGVAGTLMATEVIREITGFGKDQGGGLVGKLLLVDLMTLRFDMLAYGRDPALPFAGQAPS